jgi:hypothetical protein
MQPVLIDINGRTKIFKDINMFVSWIQQTMHIFNHTDYIEIYRVGYIESEPFKLYKEDVERSTKKPLDDRLFRTNRSLLDLMNKHWSTRA